MAIFKNTNLQSSQVPTLTTCAHAYDYITQKPRILNSYIFI